jgi:hypothetical protein
LAPLASPRLLARLVKHIPGLKPGF